MIKQLANLMLFLEEHQILLAAAFILSVWLVALIFALKKRGLKDFSWSRFSIKEIKATLGGKPYQ